MLAVAEIGGFEVPVDFAYGIIYGLVAGGDDVATVGRHEGDLVVFKVYYV